MLSVVISINHKTHNCAIHTHSILISEQYADLYDVSEWKVIYVKNRDKDCRDIVGIPRQLWRAFHRSGVTVSGIYKATSAHLTFQKGTYYIYLHMFLCFRPGSC